MENTDNINLYHIFDELIEGCQIIDFDWKYLYINNAAAKHNQRPKEELLGNRYMDMWPGITETEVFRLIENCLTERKNHQMENKFVFPNGNIGWFDLSIQPVPEGAFILSVDVTKQKRLEQDLRESEERWKFAIEGAGDGLWDWNAETNKVFYSSSLKSMLGYGDDEFKNELEEWEIRVHPDDLKSVYKALEDHYAGRTPYYQSEHRLLCKDGSYKWIQDQGKVISWISEGKPLRIIGTHRDIDIRKKAELELKLQKERFEKFSATVPGLLCSFHRSPEQEYSMPYASNAGLDIYGYSTDQLNENFGIVFERIHLDDINGVIESIEQSAKHMQPWKNKFRYTHPGKGEVWLSGHSVPIPDSDGGITWHGYVDDITEEVAAEKALEESEEKFYKLFHSNPVGLHLFRLEDSIAVDSNDALLKLIEYEKDEVIGKTASDIHLFAQPEQRKIWQDKLKNSDNIENLEIKIRCKSGKIMTCLTSMEIVVIGGQRLVLLTAIDITRQKEIEKEISQNEKLLRLFIEHSPAAIAMFDNEMKYISYSNRFISDYSLAEENITGRSHYEIFPEIDDRIKQTHQRCLQGETIKSNEDYFPRENGKADWVRWEVRPWYTDENNVGGIILFSEVITKEVLDKLKIKESEEYIRTLFNKSITGLALVKMDGTFLEVNDAFADMVGYDKNEVLELTYWQLTPEKYEQQENEQLENIKKYGRYGPYEKEYIHKKGHLVAARLQGLVIERDGEKLIWSSVEDITEQKKAEEKNRYNQMLINQMGKVAKIGGWEFNPDTGKGTWTEQVALIHDLDDKEETNMELGISFYSDKSKPKIEKAIHEAITDGKSYNLELEMTTQKGKHKWVNTIGQPIIEDGKVINIRGSFQDITDRKHNQHKLRESEERFRSIFEQSASGMALTGIDGKIIQFNKVFSDMLGYAKKELKRTHFNDITYPEDKEIGNDVVKRLIQGKIKKATIEKRYLKKSGEPVWVHINTVLLRNQNNEPEFFISQIEDISDRVEAEQKLKASEIRYRALVEQTLTGIYIFDVSNYIYVNRRFCEIFGYTEDEILNSLKPNEIIESDDREIVNENAQKRLRGEIESAGFIVKGNHKSGKPLWIEIYGKHIQLNNKDVIIGTVIDITDKKLAEDKIIKLNEDLENKVIFRTAQLESKNKELETFTYSVSHDLKAPLRGIDGYSKLLEEIYGDKLEDESKYFLQSIREGTRQMNQLIEDLLSYSRLERAMIRQTTFNLQDFIHQMLSLYKNQIEVNKVEITENVSNIELHTDIDSLSVAVRNILGNAIKFSSDNDSPKIEISCKPKKDYCVLAIKDNGIGLDMKYKERIFEIFQRLNLAEKFPGTGIGLAMVKKSIERIGGNVRVESTPGDGATFYLEIPKTNHNENI